MNQYANDFTDTVKTYYDDLKKYKPLPRSQEKKLLKLCKKGDINAKNRILESNLRFVFDTAKKYTGRGVPISELISVGNMGLIKAIEKYNDSRDVKFISYAVWWIKQAMMDAIKKNGLIKFVELEQQNDNSHVIEKAFSDDDDEYVSEYDAKFSEDMGKDFEKIESTQMKLIKDLTKDLNEREKLIIEKYYGINGEKEQTLSEIGKEFNISSERARQIKIAAIRKLRSKAMLYDDVEYMF